MVNNIFDEWYEKMYNQYHFDDTFGKMQKMRVKFL